MTDRRPASGAADRDRAPDAPNPPDRTDSPGPDTVGVRHGMFGVRGSGDTTGFGGLVRPKEMPGSTPPPYEDDDDEVIRALTAALHQRGGPSFQEAVERVVVHCGQLTLHVEREHLPAVALTLRDAPDLRFEMSLGASGVHYPDATDRELHVVYPLQSITHNRRVMLETSAPDADPHIPTLTRVYPTADWHERETYDFFGVVFDGHPSLTRIEMPDDWEGHPQRKDYPLGGIPVQYKGATIPPPDQRRAYS
ncbi:NADH-quinone oxidoreductase subunit C [Dietzia sp. SLG510A3-30A2]|nr:NADH-quinone oxidoreductase subunit C [Dietzia sp. SLG510A3-30A2]